MNKSRRYQRVVLIFLAYFSLSSAGVYADVVTQWNITARNIVVGSHLPTPPSNRVLAIVHAAVFEATNAITQRYALREFKFKGKLGASIEAAVAAANHTTLLKLLPKQKLEIDQAYNAVLKNIPQSTAKQQGIIVGRAAGEAVLALRMDDGSNEIESYRPHTTAGIYVPTVIPAVPHWSNRKPWLMTSSSQFRPGPPPALNSELWAQDFKEVKSFGNKNSTVRTAEQTKMARFWEATLPPIYHGVVHSIATLPGREVTQNARLFAAITQAADDGLIGVFEAKYYYGFWRPITAIRNADTDNNPETKRDPSWLPYIPTPMHPEYPCAHCVVAGAVGTILKAEIGDGPMPLLSTSSVTAGGAIRTWSSVEDFVQEVSNARIYDGVHYRSSTEVGTVMGKQIGALAVKKYRLE